ncbi:mannitol dehydrogenase family protein [Kineococcus gynurae]|uniref:Mannitol-1-phosphate 5-dehydrogenase n=1 Tax=Kineococcus gynurae TaxID=452979 RepID=A0ABV5LW60_9ACTN
MPIEKTRPAAGIVHLGLGNFHRAHQAVYTAHAMTAEPGNWGIVGVASNSPRVVDALREQDLRYTVVELSPDGARFSVPAVHTDAYVAAREPERVVTDLAAATTRVVTLTVTEHGYHYSPRTGRLDVEDPTIVADLETLRRGAGAPRSGLGRIVAAVRRRGAEHATPLTVLSCDNLSGNGDHTGRLVREFAAELPDAEELLGFLEQRVTFPNSMVDRIVPATTDAERDLVAAGTGWADRIPVPAEPFSMWVLEDRFAAGRPAWDRAGAVLSDDVHAYEELKLRLLNGTHSLLAYLGALTGCPTIPDAAARSEIREAAHRVLREEYLPSVRVPDGVDVDRYERELFERWDNSALGHRCHQVGSDGSVKLRQRIPVPALEALDRGAVPHLLALTVAGYLTCLAPLGGFDPGPVAARMGDPVAERLREAARSCTGGSDLAALALTDFHLLGDDLAGREQFTRRVGELVDLLHTAGPAAATAEALAAPAPVLGETR